tara:strand:+ start:5680 stop:6606 length:927 start_codon:yes stop_codon:yes gene_type:complete
MHSEFDETNRRALESISYRMLGSWADAEDIAQEALLRWHRLNSHEQSSIQEPLAWLNTVATRLSLDLLKSARRQREKYVGPWLPAPILSEQIDSATAVEQDDSIHFGILLALERLNPAERAAFLLHDIFGYSFEHIASTLEKSIPACRKLASRARTAIQTERTRFETSPTTHQRLLEAFLHAIRRGDDTTLTSLLAEDVALYSDGGGMVPAVRRVLRTPKIVSRVILGLERRQRKLGLQKEPRFRSLNGHPGALLYLNGELDTTVSIAIVEGRIQSIFQQRNPEKLFPLIAQLEPTPKSQRSILDIQI